MAAARSARACVREEEACAAATSRMMPERAVCSPTAVIRTRRLRSEEHTSELQSPCNLVCRLLLEKKKPCPTLTYKTTTYLSKHHVNQFSIRCPLPPRSYTPRKFPDQTQAPSSTYQIVLQMIMISSWSLAFCCIIVHEVLSHGML